MGSAVNENFKVAAGKDGLTAEMTSGGSCSIGAAEWNGSISLEEQCCGASTKDELGELVEWMRIQRDISGISGVKSIMH